MKSNLVHIFINVSDKEISYNFYKLILGNLGYKVEFEDGNQLGLNNGKNEIWLRPINNGFPNKFDRNNVGLNHLAFRVDEKSEVKDFHQEIFVKNKIPTLYSSPRIFPDFTDDYFAVYFEDPDGIKLEVTFYTHDFEI